jgi:membrane-bound lytic murein transglycosylase D
MKRYLLLCCLAFSLQSYGATPQVPSTMWFANIRLHLSKEAKKRVQEKVDSLTRNEKYFQTILDRANLFLPIIERVLKEENLPLDFRYLVMQESALVSDAVSTANAVGFWQFKEPAAREVGLKIDRNVDERMHITAATRAAAKYLKQHNREFDNWLYALVAYNEGRVGARKFIQKHYLGAKKMHIERQAHVYLIHFLAYKIAFEQVLGKDSHPELYLYEYQEVHGKNLNEIAQELGVDVEQVKDYNKWLKRYRVPRDTTCAAIVPMTHRQYARQGTSKKKDALAKNNIDYIKHWEKADNFPAITFSKEKNPDARIIVINNIAGVVALEGDSAVSLAKAGRISLTKFLAFNDLDKSCSIIPGQVYYYRPKQSKARIYFHIVRSGETWWSVAQKYGIRQEALLHKNRLRKEVALKTGRVLWLRFIRPANLSVAYAHHSSRVSAPEQK